MIGHEQLAKRLEELRSRLDRVFAKDTAAPDSTGHGSAGHCAVVAVMLQDMLGGELVSTRISGLSHWFNRLVNNAVWIDVDITGDQFYGPAVRIGDPGEVWNETRSRSRFEVNRDTLRRYALLSARLAGVA